MTSIPLTILAIVDTPSAGELFRRVFNTIDETLFLTGDLAEGLALAASQAPQLVFVDVSLGHNAGLALVHHIPALAPSAAVYALADLAALAVGAQATALGGAGLIVMPPSGDELRSAANAVRARLAAAEQARDLELIRRAPHLGILASDPLAYASFPPTVDGQPSLPSGSQASSPSTETPPYSLSAFGLIKAPPQLSTAGTSTESSDTRLAQSKADPDLTSAVAALADCPDRSAAATKLAAIFSDLTGAIAVVVYLFADEAASQLAQSGASGSFPEAPTFADEMGLMTFAQQNHCELIPIAVRQLAQGHVLLAGLPTPLARRNRSALDLVAAQAAITLALVAERERSTRGAIKDLTTSAYTFAYFVDIAGREIDKARRYGRRFALATITLREDAGQASDIVDAVLSAVRDTDVLARVDDREFYLLMPETGGVGAQSCRRRVLHAAAARAAHALDGSARSIPLSTLTMGVATYPHDGTDLSRLLRAAKRRADASHDSIVRTLGLEQLTLPELVDELLHRFSGSPQRARGTATPRPICLTLRDTLSLALTIVGEALRGGPTLVVMAHHPELGLSSSVRATFGPDRDGLLLHSLDLREVPKCANLQFFSVIAEHAAYVLLGWFRISGFYGIHASDPSLVDLVTLRAGQAVGVRLLD